MIDVNKLYSKAGLTDKQQEIRQLAINHLEAFIRLVAPFQALAHCHIDLCKWLEKHQDENKLLLWPRDHGKSRYAAFFTAWQIIRDPSITVIYASATAEKAEEQVRFIKDILENKHVTKYFPGIVNPDEGKRAAWNKTYIIVDHPKRQDEGVVDSTIMTAGVEKNITGKHCKLLVLDDIVVPENNTEEGRKKVNGWAAQAASVLSNDGAILCVGTRYHPKDAYQIMMESNITIHDQNGDVVSEEPLYVVNIANVESEGDFLWPRQMRTDGKWFGFNRDILARKRAVYDANGEITQFYAQYYNDPNDKSTAPIARDLFQYYEKKQLEPSGDLWFMDGKLLRVYAAIDLAASLNKKADYTAIVIGGIDDLGNRYLLDALHYKSDKSSETLNNLVSLYQKYRYRKIRLEAVAGFRLVAEDLAANLREKGVRIPVDFYHPNQHTANGLVGKDARVNGILEPLYQGRAIYHYRGGFAQVLEDELCMAQPPHDDLKDAWAMCNDIMEMPIKRKAKYNRSTVVYHPRFGGIAVA